MLYILQQLTAATGSVSNRHASSYPHQPFSFFFVVLFFWGLSHVMPQTGNIASALCLGEQLADFGPGKQTEIPWI